MRKGKAMTPERVRKLLVAGYEQPEMNEAADLAAKEAKQTARKQAAK